MELQAITAPKYAYYVDSERATWMYNGQEWRKVLEAGDNPLVNFESILRKLA